MTTANPERMIHFPVSLFILQIYYKDYFSRRDLGQEAAYFFTGSFVFIRLAGFDHF